jgi:competence protein ComEC
MIYTAMVGGILLSGSTYGLLLGGCILLATAFWLMKSQKLSDVSYVWRLVIVALVAGFLLGANAHQQESKWMRWPTNEKMIIEGVIRGIPQRGSGDFTATLHTPNGLVHLSYPVDLSPLHHGDQVTMTGVLQLPSGATNPGEFDFARYLRHRGIYRTLRISHSDQLIAVHPGRNSIQRWAGLLHRRADHLIQQTLQGNKGALLTALVLGNRRLLPDDFHQDAAQSGLSHLLAVSGFHVGFAGMVFSLLARLIVPQPRYRWLLVGGGIWFFALMAGAGIGVTRAALMVTLGWTMMTFLRMKDNRATIWTAALLMTMAQPFIFLDPGFQLSFTATAAIVHLIPILQRTKGWNHAVSRVIMISMVVQWAIWPLLAIHYHRVPIWTLVFQLWLIPFMGMGVFLGVAAIWLGLIFPAGGHMIHISNGFIMDGIWATVQLAGRYPALGWNTGVPHWFWLAGWYLILIAFFRDNGYFRPVRWRWGVAAIIWGILFFCWQTVAPFSDPVRVTFLNVGQGDAIVIQPRYGPALLVDGGLRSDHQGKITDQGMRVVVPFLRSQGINHLRVLLTHGHDDHVGGLISVCSRMQVIRYFEPSHTGETQQYTNLEQVLKRRKIPRQVLFAGQSIQLGPAAWIEVLNPQLENPAFWGLNDQSIVLRLRHKDDAVLLTGDIERDSIRWLLDSGQNLNSKILKVPHHGSSGSLVDGFYERVDMKAAIISVGVNRYGHPAASVITGLNDACQMVFRTDQDGAVILRWRGALMHLRGFASGRVLNL